MQFGIEKGAMEWGVDISRTCDMLWVGVTANPELDCNAWICDQPDTFLVSEESTILADVYKSYVGGAATPFPSLIPATDGPGKLAFLVDFHPTDVGGFWCAASFRLDMDAGELWMEVAEGGGNLSERVLVRSSLFTCAHHSVHNSVIVSSMFRQCCQCSDNVVAVMWMGSLRVVAT